VVSAAVADERGSDQDGHSVTVAMGSFAWEALEHESVETGVPVEDLVAFAVMYYLADLDSGRIARRIARSPYPEAGSYPDAGSFPDGGL
jgi:hypothetical protein